MATFMVMGILGYSVNMFTLFGLLLAIGVVVDDAICVTERVSYLMNTEKMNAMDATKQTMQEISGALVATTLVLLAIFVPIAFLGGITGKIYQQFSVTICAAVCFSTLCALTLAPAICSHFFKPSQLFERGPFGWFNKALEKSTNATKGLVLAMGRKIVLIGLVFVAFSAISVIMFKNMTTSFLPNENIFLAAAVAAVITLGFLLLTKKFCKKTCI
jgi:multidrug efflux pump subunit AcrB